MITLLVRYLYFVTFKARFERFESLLLGIAYSVDCKLLRWKVSVKILSTGQLIVPYVVAFPDLSGCLYSTR